MISANLRAGNEAVKTRFRTDLLVKPRDGSVHAQAVMNGSLLHTDNAGERTLHFEARVGVNAFEGSVKQAGRRTGFWKFDFSGTPPFRGRKSAGSKRANRIPGRKVDHFRSRTESTTHTIHFRSESVVSPFPPTPITVSFLYIQA